MHREYRAAMAAAEDDPAVRAIVVSGDPEGRAFCVGGDAEALAGHVERGSYDAGTGEPAALAHPGYGVAQEFDQDFAFQMAMTKPIIAAVNGAAAGVGLAIVCFADIRIVTAEAKLTTAHGPLGLPAEYGLSWLLPRQVGVTRATDLLLTSRIFTGSDAGDWGLATEVSPTPEETVSRAFRYAADMLSRSAPTAIASSKRQLALDLHRDIGSSVADAGERLAQMMTSEEYAAGVARLRGSKRPGISEGDPGPR